MHYKTQKNAIFLLEGENGEARIDLAVGNSTSTVNHFLLVNTTATTTGASILVLGSLTQSLGNNAYNLRLDNAGNVLIGGGLSSNNKHLLPQAKLHVSSGDVYLDNSANGIIMTSPSGACWKVTVGDTGTLTSTSITCP